MDTLILGQSKLGKAVFANKDFKEGKEIIEIARRTKIFVFSDLNIFIIFWRNQFWQFPSFHWLPFKLDDFFNHSCNPNSGIKIVGKRVILVAINDIKKGEEITWDYSTTMDEDEWEMDCMCKCKNCRKRIKDFKYLPKEIQQKYMKLGIVPKYILENLKRNPE